VVARREGHRYALLPLVGFVLFDIVRKYAYILEGGMGFRQVKSQVIDCLLQGRIMHGQGNAIDMENPLATGLSSLSRLRR
jgi:hypothetical protein